MKGKLKTGLAALGLAMASSSALAAVNWTLPVTEFEDDNIDFVWYDAGGDKAVSIGDVLVAPFEINKVSGLDVGPGEELTGISVIEVTGFAVNGHALFGPYSGGMDVVLAQGGLAALPDSLGIAGGPAMVAMWLDKTPNLSISGAVTNCTSFADCLARAGDGDIFQIDGMGNALDPDADEYWRASALAGASYTIPQSTTGDQGITIDAGLSTYFRGAGHPFTLNAIPCSGLSGPFGVLGLCGADNAFNDVGIFGPINGGAGLPAGLKNIAGAMDKTAAGAQAIGISDFDLLKAPVPSPGSLSLLAAGLLGFGLSLRGKKKAKTA